MRLDKKIILLCKSIKKSIYYFFRAIFSQSSGVDKNSTFLVTLTSYGLRKNFVFLTIESILHQHVRPAKIVLWLHKKDKPQGIARWILSRQQKRGLEIVFVDNDVRSYKKLSFVPGYYPDYDFYITADDDVFYPTNWIDSFKSNINDNPDAVYCYRGRAILFNDAGSLVAYPVWPLARRKEITGNELLPTGVSGVCYPRDSLDARVADYEAINKLCPYADDIWYKALTTARGYNAILINDDSTHFTPIITGFTKGLEKINVLNDQNTQQFLNAMNYFNLDLNSFRGNYKRNDE
ncbi:hypothetical protein ACOZ2B_000750 [Cronobacter sakazakii]